MASQSAMNLGMIPGGVSSGGRVASAAVRCPACDEPMRSAAVERYGKYERFACSACELEFWEPREMPDAGWYEQMYRGRDQQLLPLEPGHKYFLADPHAPGSGALLDIGCGTGNFLAASHHAGYRVTGLELDRNAASFAEQLLDVDTVLPLTITGFVERHPEAKFDVVTFFEVLEHQAAPREFLDRVRACLRSGGLIALSVPNRYRWLTGPDVLDYPPNHFLRWSAAALTKFLSAQGFEILSLREQPPGITHTAQMINMALRTGLTRPKAGEPSRSFRDVMQMKREEAEAALRATPTMRERMLGVLGRIKYAACFPLAVAALPYVRMRGYKGTYMYCLAKKRD